MTNHRAGLLSASEYVSMFVQVFFVVSSHCSRASVACGYVFLLRPLVEVNRELQKHTLESIIELLMLSVCLVWCMSCFKRLLLLDSFVKCHSKEKSLCPSSVIFHLDFFVSAKVSVKCRVLILYT